MIQCVQKDHRLTCTFDLSEGAALRTMLEQSLRDIIVFDPKISLTLQDYIPEFVHDLIAAATEKNQSPEMVAVAHGLVDRNSTPQQCTMIIDVMKDYLQARTSRGDYSERRSEGPGVHIPWGLGFKREMGKIWYRMLTIAGLEIPEDEGVNATVGVRG